MKRGDAGQDTAVRGLNPIPPLRHPSRAPAGRSPNTMCNRQHYLAARNLKHGLEGRETIEDLKNQGLYLVSEKNRTQLAVGMADVWIRIPAVQ